MIIKQNIDQSKLREHSEKMGVPIVELLLKKLDHLSKKENIKYTLFAACPNSYNDLIYKNLLLDLSNINEVFT